MFGLNMNDVRCEALFASGLQPTDAVTPDEVAEVISRVVRRIGVAGCVGKMAQEFGDHPEVAAKRMRWVRQLVGDGSAASGERPMAAGRLGARSYAAAAA
jgi:hypothetical protein